MKKVLSQVVSLLMLMLLFVGCITNSRTSYDSSAIKKSSGQFSPEDGANLLLTVGKDDEEYAIAVAEKFNQEYNVAVTVKVLYNDDILNKASDVYITFEQQSADGMRSGSFLQLNSGIVDDLKKDMNNIALKAVTIDDKTYGVPISIDTSVMLYNKKLVTGEPANSIEQILKEAREYNNERADKIWFLADISNGSILYSMLSVYGFNLFGENGNDNNPGFDTEEFKKGLEVVKKYSEVMPLHYANGESPAISSDCLKDAKFINDQFTGGKTAYMLGDSATLKAVKDPTIELNIAPLPTYDSKQQKPFASVKSAYISASTKYPKASQLLAYYLSTKESAEILYSKGYQITARKDITDIKGLKDDKLLLEIADAFNNAAPMPNVKGINYCLNLFGNIGPSVYDKKMTPEQAQTKVIEDWNKFKS